MVMATSKIKYYHHLYDNQAVRELTNSLLNEALYINKITCKKLAFDSGPVHRIINLSLYCKPEIAKRLKGYVAKNIFRFMPWLKNDMWDGGYFWNSGFWNPAYNMRSINDMDFYSRYLDKQEYSGTGQKMLAAF